MGNLSWTWIWSWLLLTWIPLQATISAKDRHHQVPMPLPKAHLRLQEPLKTGTLRQLPEEQMDPDCTAMAWANQAAALDPSRGPLLRRVHREMGRPPHPPRPAPLPVRTATQAEKKPPTAGPIPASTWKVTPSPKQWSACMPSTDRNCKPDAFQGSHRLDAWLAYGGRPIDPTGTRCKPKPGSDSPDRDWKNGTSSSLPPHTTRGGADGADQDPREQPPEAGKHGPFFRPRGCRAVAFQKPGHLHPYSRPAQVRPRRKRNQLLHRQRPSIATGDPGDDKTTNPTPRGLDPCPSHDLRSRINHQKPHQPKGPSGPKSGGRRPFPSALKLVTIYSTVGARVSSAVAAEEGPGLGILPRLGKRSDLAQPGGGTTTIIQTPSLNMQAKRAYKRACRRANTSPLQGTMYKGRWHTRQALAAMYHQPPEPQPPAMQANRRHRQRPSRPLPTIRMFSWNVGGLSSALYQELQAWIATSAQWDLIILQETHWRSTADYVSGDWLCIHSSSYDVQDTPDRHAGVMILLSKKAFRDVAVHEHIAGRLLQVRATHIRSQLPVDIFGVYQHVYRTHLTASQNKTLRGKLWDCLQKTLNGLPARHQIIMAGDFNSTLSAQLPHIGPATPKTTQHNNHDPCFQQLLLDHELCALNTWHARPHHTYKTPSTKSQIDYIITKNSTATHTSRQSSPIHNFPVAGDRLANHVPVQAILQLRPFQLRQPAKQPATAYDANALNWAVQVGEPAAEAMRLEVADKIAALPADSPLTALHSSVNEILMQAVCKHFPPKAREDRRVSANPGFRASATRTWQLYHAMKAQGALTMATVWQKWRAYAMFARASRELRRQSKHLKVAFHQDQLHQAEAAAKAGNHRDLFQVIRRLGPRSTRIATRLKDKQGHLMTAQAELESFMEYGQATFAQFPDTIPLIQSTEDLTFREADVQMELQHLKPRKAVPKHIAPNAVWRLCAGNLSRPLCEALNRHFQAGSQDSLEHDMIDTYVIWLPKPSKPPAAVASLRPIGLMPPYPKLVAGLLAKQIQHHIRPQMAQLPQFAYYPDRGCADALLRVHNHFEAVEAMLSRDTENRFSRRQGHRSKLCAGGLCLSLDLSKAFDCVCRDQLTNSLLSLGVPPNIVAAVQQLHKQAKYHYDIRSQQGHTTTTNGIKQGCRVAPGLWLCYSITVMQGLVGQRCLDWLQRVVTLFADDWCGCWQIESRADFLQALRDLELILETLTIFKLTINYQKTALLLKLKGKEAAKLLKQHTYDKEGQTYLRLCVLGQERSLCIRTSHVYLGTVVSYESRLDLNVAHRIASAQHKYQHIRKVLNGRSPLSTRHKLRLWSACIIPSLLYSLEVVSCTPQGAAKLLVLCTRHLRAILKQPAHLTHTSNEAIWAASQLSQPLQLVDARLGTLIKRRQSTLHAAGADIATNEEVLATLKTLQDRLQQILHRPQPQSQPTTEEAVVCPHCDAPQASAHALSIHIALKHPEVIKDKPALITFNAALHSIAGMPTCKLCLRNFVKWQQLRLHIERSSCPALGGDSFKLSPPKPDNHTLRLLPTPPVQTQQATSEPRANIPDALPLVLQTAFHDDLPRWEKRLSCPTTKALLSTNCVICNMWIADIKHIRQHYNKVHHQNHPNILPQALQLSKTFKSHLTRGKTCRWCKATVGAPGRHSTQCAVLNQLLIGVCYCQQGLHRQDDTSRPGGQHLCVLHADGSPASKIPSTDLGSVTTAGSGGPAGPHDPKEAATERRSGASAQAPFFGAAVAPTPSASISYPGTTPGPPLQAAPQARGGTGRAEKGHGLHHVFQAGRQVPAPQPYGGSESLASKSIRTLDGGLTAELSTTHGADQLFVERTPPKDPESGGNRGRARRTQENRLAGFERPLGVSEVESTTAATDHEPSQGTGHSRRDHQDHNGTPGVHDWRDHSPLQVKASPMEDRRRRPPAGGLRTGHLTEELDGRRCTSKLRQADGMCSHTPGWHDDEKGRQASPTASSAAGSAHLPRQDQHCKPGAAGLKDIRHFFRANTAHHTTTTTTTTTTTNSDIANRSCSLPTQPTPPSSYTPNRTPPALPNLKLHNPQNHCYLNALVYCLAALEKHANRCILPAAFRNAQTPLSAMRELGFHMMGWHRPHQQHDVGEFADFLLPKLRMYDQTYTWSARQFLEGEFRHTDSGTLRACLSLSTIDPSGPDVQTLIQRWHQQQSSMHALHSPPPWLFVQLPRATRSPEGPSKSSEAYIIPQELLLPSFCDTVTLNVRWVTYRLLACVTHHGPHLCAGHYRTLVRVGQTSWILDDARKAAKASAQQLEEASTCMYVLLLVQTSATPEAVSQLSSDSLDSHGDHARDPAAAEGQHLAHGARTPSAQPAVPGSRSPTARAPESHGGPAEPDGRDPKTAAAPLPDLRHAAQSIREGENSHQAGDHVEHPG